MQTPQRRRNRSWSLEAVEDLRVQLIQVWGCLLTLLTTAVASGQRVIAFASVATNDFLHYWQTSSNPSQQNKSRKLENYKPLVLFSNFYCSWGTIVQFFFCVSQTIFVCALHLRLNVHIQDAAEVINSTVILLPTTASYVLRWSFQSSTHSPLLYHIIL